MQETAADKWNADERYRFVRTLLVHGEMEKGFLGGWIARQQFALESSLEILAGSRLPSEAFVGVISQPSSRRTLRLPLLPGGQAAIEQGIHRSKLSVHGCVDSFMALHPMLSRRSRRFRSFPTSTREPGALRPHSRPVDARVDDGPMRKRVTPRAARTAPEVSPPATINRGLRRLPGAAQSPPSETQ